MNNAGLMTILFHNTRGQAATEFLIAAVYVLVPLFLFIPLVGKYIDVKQAVIQQARFEAWEYTAWFMHKPIMDIPKHNTGMRSAVRPWKETRKAGALIFFSDITASDYGTGNVTGAIGINPLWRDHRGQSLFSSGDTVRMKGSLVEKETPNPTGKHFINDLINGIADITKAVKKWLHFEGQHAGFDALNTKGYFQSHVEVTLRGPEEVVPAFILGGIEASTAQPLHFKAKAAVLAENWDAGSTKNTIAETKGLVLSSLLAPFSNKLNKILNTMQSVLYNLNLGPLRIIAKLPNAPSFGYVKNGLIPYEHLQGNNKEVTSYKGLYYYRKKKK